MAIRPIAELEAALSRLPGLGRRSASRAALALVREPSRLMEPLAEALREAGGKKIRAAELLARHAGVTGMIAGQVMDLWCEKNAVSDASALSYIQRDKTACMFIYPLRAAGWLSGADEAQIDALGCYGEQFGRVFQATDDLLDVVGDSAEMGKTLGKDAEQGKLTMVSLYGVEGTRSKVAEQLEEALHALEGFGDQADFFRDLVRSMVDRTN